jgi:glycosyltransferase involved in cell wall biosynthesis
MAGRLYWLSPAMRSHYGAKGEGWDSCIPECVGPLSPLPAAEGRTGVTLRLGGAGLRVRWKRWDLVVRALAQLPAEVRGRIEFEQLGADGPGSDGLRYAQELHALTRQSGLDAWVKWLPAEPDSRRLLAQVDAVVVASHCEPMSLVMLEALNAGVPVIAADSGGAPDVIRPGINGWLFQDGNAADLARLLSNLARDRPDRLLERRSFLPAGLTAASVAARWLSVYSALPAAKPASQS